MPPRWLGERRSSPDRKTVPGPAQNPWLPGAWPLGGGPELVSEYVTVPDAEATSWDRGQDASYRLINFRPRGGPLREGRTQEGPPPSMPDWGEIKPYDADDSIDASNCHSGDRVAPVGLGGIDIACPLMRNAGHWAGPDRIAARPARTPSPRRAAGARRQSRAAEQGAGAHETVSIERIVGAITEIHLELQADVGPEL